MQHKHVKLTAKIQISQKYLFVEKKYTGSPTNSIAIYSQLFKV